MAANFNIQQGELMTLLNIEPMNKELLNDPEIKAYFERVSELVSAEVIRLQDELIIYGAISIECPS